MKSWCNPRLNVASVLFCSWKRWNMHLHLAVQTCVRQRMPRRLLGMAAFSGLYRFEVRGTTVLDTTYIGFLDSDRRKTQSAFTGKTADNL